MTRSVLLWLSFIPLNFLKMFAGRLLAPIVVLFASEDGWLPSWLSWFQTPDNSLDGDEGWKIKHWQWRMKFPEPLRTYVGRVGWLWRNNMYGFSIDVMGAEIKEGFSLSIKGDPNVSNRPLHNGTVFRKVTMPDGPVYWQWYYVQAWSSTYCVRINLGWKLWGDLAPGIKKQFVFSPNPFMGYSK